MHEIGADDAMTEKKANRAGLPVGNPPETTTGGTCSDGTVVVPADLLDGVDDAATALAEQWWPGRYVGDLTQAEWGRVYRAVLDDVMPNISGGG